MSTKRFLLSVALLTGAVVLLHRPASAEKSTNAPTGTEQILGEIASAARNFLTALDDEQKKQASFPLLDAERQNWHYVPIERKGLSLKEMQPEQRHLAYALLSAGLSHEGFRKAAEIMSLEKILFELENKAPHRDPEKYFVCIFGTPDPKGTWAWRFEGHHLSLSFTLVEGKHIAITPSFLGANPGLVASGPRQGLEVLAEEEALGFALVNSLDETQKKIAVFDTKAPEDIITKEEKRAKPLQPAGITADKLNEAQKVTLTKILGEYFGRFHPSVAEAEVKKILDAGWEKIAFAWAGGFEPGKAHYYRVQGATFLIEYDNIQNNARHPHAVLRDFTNDFGEDLLKTHYKAAHE